MRFGRTRTPPALVLALFGSIVAGRASARSPAVVHVDLMDPSSGPSVKSMMIKPDQTSVKAGSVKFLVSNNSKTLVHEMIVVSVTDPNTPLPYDRKDDRVIESKIKDLGEASDLPPGTKKTLSLTLKPGDYMLMCNQPGHYKEGMKASLTVTR
ncbi:MAG: plastocyanin/azurin family copper-binding protein [Roseiarcus sp.]